MSIGRMAGQFLRRAQIYGLPGSGGEALARFGLDAAMSGLYAASMPGDYANAGEKVGLFAEDMLSQSVPGMLTAGLAGAGARRFGVNPRTARMIANGADMVGSMAGPMAASMLHLKPIQGSLDARMQQNAELQRQMELENAFQQGLNNTFQTWTETSPMVQGIGNLIG